MNKPKKVRGSATLKTLAFLLALVLAVGVCVSAGAILRMSMTNERYQLGSYNYELSAEQADELPLYLFLNLHRYALTEEGQRCYMELHSAFLRTNTNFSYVIYDDVGDVVMSNCTDEHQFGEDTLEQTGERYFDGYELGYNRMISYYLDLSNTYDWKVSYGTPLQWSRTGNASAYYYNEDAVPLDEEAADEAAALEEEMAAAANAETAAETAATVEITVFEDADESAALEPEAYEEPVEEPATEDVTTYCYFVYTGTFPGYRIAYGVDTSYPVSDTYADTAQEGESYRLFYATTMPVALSICISCFGAFALVLTYLTLAIGWNKEGELALRGLNRLPIEIVLGGAGFAVILSAVIFSDAYWGDSLLTWMVLCGLAGIPGALGALTLWLVAAAQIKTRTFLRRSIVWRFLKWLYRGCLGLAGRVKRMARQWPLYDKVGIFWLIYWGAYLLYLGVVAFDEIWEYGLWGLILFGTLPLLPLAVFTCKWALDWAKLRKSVKEMVAGHLDYTIDTRGMIPDVKSHGEDLSNLSAGLSRAVEERLKSERFKTELITNVSHDLKTPLTSIINYVDLLKHLDIQDETARGYIDVLDRKSQRLKTLTEDLVEASKAASGTLAVQLERLDVGQLVEQAVAEYEERLEQAGLTTVVNIPQRSSTVMADGRHLWRVLDNLLGNCTKYAMPGTRVYLDVEEMVSRCVITVKNISADPLNIPAEDLLKRFVRGDSSRSTEGSGLGLSIARNLTTAQGGEFDLVVDGDLFKAIVTFPLAAPAAEMPRTAAPAKELPPQPETAEPAEVPEDRGLPTNT
ncbi:MAG: HAMP domain-containing histidine kinase [Oscillospiraceae bacterium]|nr:HAMP domain-containing histidine kinase [Oscillospiraceae bacterium]